MDKHYFKRTTGYYTEHGRYISTLCGPSYAQFCDSEYGHMIDNLDDNPGYYMHLRFRYKHDKFLVDQFQNDDLSIVFNKHFNCEPNDFPFEKDFIKAPIDVIIKKFCEWQEIKGEVILYNINDYPELDTCNIKELLAVELKSFTVLSILHDLDIALRLSSKFFIQKNKKFTELFYAHFHVLLKIHVLYKKLYNPDVDSIRYHNIDDFFEDFIKYAPEDECLLLTYSSSILFKIKELRSPFALSTPIATPLNKQLLLDYYKYIQKHFGGFSHAPKPLQYSMVALANLTAGDIDQNEFYVDFDSIVSSISPSKYASFNNGFCTGLCNKSNRSKIITMGAMRQALYQNTMPSVQYGWGWCRADETSIDLNFNPTLMRFYIINPFLRDRTLINFGLDRCATRIIVSQPNISHKEFQNTMSKLDPNINFDASYSYQPISNRLCLLLDFMVLKTLAAISTYDSEHLVEYLEELEGNKFPSNTMESSRAFKEDDGAKYTDIHLIKELLEKLKLVNENPSYEILAGYSKPFIGKLSATKMRQLWKMICDNENNIKQYMTLHNINLNLHFDAISSEADKYANYIDHVLINHIISMEQKQTWSSQKVFNFNNKIF